jgi:hypothetical protein
MLLFFFLDIEDFRGAGFDAGAADDALIGGFGVGFVDDEAEGADFGAFAAVDAFLFVDGVDTEFVGGNSFFRTVFGAFAALYAGFDFDIVAFKVKLDAGIFFVSGFVEFVSAGHNAGGACHTFVGIGNSDFLFHYDYTPFVKK